MKHYPALPSVCLAACLAGSFGAAHDVQADDEELVINKNRLNIAARFGFNVRATLRNLGAPVAAGPAFDDGFVRRDISGNAGGKTTYWGYLNNNQVVGNNLEMHSATSPRDGTSQSFTDSPQTGFELSYGRELGRFKLFGRDNTVWGVEGGFGSMDFSVKHTDTLAGNTLRTTTTFGLGGILPPVAPFAGTYTGPGPLLDATSNGASVSSVVASSTMTAKVDALLYGVKVGPFLEVPLFKRVSLQLGAGLALLNAEADLIFGDQVTVGGSGGSPALWADKYTKSEWIVGAYGRATVAYAFSDAISLFLGAQYEHLGNLEVRGPGRQATLELGSTIEAMAGIRFSF